MAVNNMQFLVVVTCMSSTIPALRDASLFSMKSHTWLIALCLPELWFIVSQLLICRSGMAVHERRQRNVSLEMIDQMPNS